MTLYSLTNNPDGSILLSPVDAVPAPKPVVGKPADKPEDKPASNRVLFCSPVTGKMESLISIFGPSWFIALGYATLYQDSTAYHTGVDLNLPGYADSGKPIYASADGIVTFAGVVSGWQGEVVVIHHALETGIGVWTRYAHVMNVYVKANDLVHRGDKIAVIADYNSNGPRDDHLHFDVGCYDTETHIDLGMHPGDWPGMDVIALRRRYFDPSQWLKQRAA